MSDKHFLVPEQVVEMGTGFISEIAARRREVRGMGRAESMLHLVKRGLDLLFELPYSTVLTTITIVVTLFLFSSFLIFLQNVGTLIVDAGGSRQLTVYVADDASKEQISAFEKKLQSDRNVRKLRFISKLDALELFRSQLGEHAEFVTGLERDNPLPMSFDLSLHPDQLGIELSMRKYAKQLRDEPIVTDVVYGSEWTDHVRSLLRVFQFIGVLSLFVFFVVVLFIISTTIQLVIYARRDEISVMRLVGATDVYIRVPFMISGLLQGFVGSCISLVFLKLAFSVIVIHMQRLILVSIVLPRPSFLGTTMCVMVIVMGAVVGMVGSTIALRRYMEE